MGWNSHKNFVMAFFWNIYDAAPLTHWLFSYIFERNKAGKFRK